MNLNDTRTSSIGSWLLSSIFPGVTFLKNSFLESFRLLNIGAYLSLITDSFNRQGIQPPKIQSDGDVIDTKVRVRENSNLFNSTEAIYYACHWLYGDLSEEMYFQDLISKEFSYTFRNSTEILTQGVSYLPGIWSIERCIKKLLLKVKNCEISQEDFDKIIKDARELTKGLKNGYLITATIKYLSEISANKYDAVVTAVSHLNARAIYTHYIAHEFIRELSLIPKQFLNMLLYITDYVYEGAGKLSILEAYRHIDPNYNEPERLNRTLLKLGKYNFALGNTLMQLDTQSYIIRCIEWPFNQDLPEIDDTDDINVNHFEDRADIHENGRDINTQLALDRLIKYTNTDIFNSKRPRFYVNQLIDWLINFRKQLQNEQLTEKVNKLERAKDVLCKNDSNFGFSSLLHLDLDTFHLNKKNIMEK